MFQKKNVLIAQNLLTFSPGPQTTFIPCLPDGFRSLDRVP